MTGENQTTHGWTEKRARRAGSSRDEAWLAHQICRIVAQELEEPIKALHERLDRLERRMDQQRLVPRTFTEAREQ